MRDPEDVPIHHLVVDSAGFVKNAPLIDLGSKIYTIQGVVDELKDRATRQRVAAYPFDIIYQEPSAESIKAVIDVSKKTGDYASLSVTDLRVLALTLDLHVEHCGTEGVVYDVKRKEPEWIDKSKKKSHHGEEKSKSEKVVENMDKELAKEDDAELIKQTLDELCNEVSEIGIEDTIMEEEEEDTSGKQRLGFGTWVDESNLFDVVSRMQSSGDPTKRKMKVACLTTDFPLQNVLLHMKLNICAIDGLRVRNIRTFILRCRICKKTTPLITKKFCPNCGHESLHKVGVSVDKDGNQRIYINWERERVTRGYRYSLPTPKSGKHANNIRVTEDHLVKVDRMAKVVQDPTSDAPFDAIDVTSRSALLGTRTRFGRKMPRNPNELQGGKKRGGKKR